MEGERCEHVQLCATALGFNVRLRAGRAVPRINCEGEAKQQEKNPPESDFSNVSVTEPEESLCWSSGGKQFGAGYSKKARGILR